jgi:predicted MarR family transcription regulator
LKLGLLDSEKRGKEVFYRTSESGRELCERYRKVREECLLEPIQKGGMAGEDLREIASALRVLSGYYDQASRAASSL